MLSTLISNVAGYFSKYFFATTYLPILISALINGAAAYFFLESFHDWLDSQLLQADSLAKSAFGTAVIGILTLVAAFVLSGLLDFLRRLMEGRWWQWLQRPFLPLQDQRLQRMRARLDEVRRERQELEELPGWKEEVREARAQTGQRAAFSPDDDRYLRLSRNLDRWDEMRSTQEAAAAKELGSAFCELSGLFRAFLDGPGDELDHCHVRLNGLADYARRARENEHMRLLTELQSGFGVELAPTRMGNIANAIQAYAVRRYNCNLELFWTSLQLQLGTAAKEALQDSKGKLDFMVATTWLAIASTVTWLVILGAGDAPPAPFLVLAFAGPVACWIGYLAATEQYRAFADVMTSCLDLHRFDLLKALRVPTPYDLEEERAIWDDMHALANYAPEERETDNLRYQHASAKA